MIGDDKPVTTTCGALRLFEQAAYEREAARLRVARALDAMDAAKKHEQASIEALDAAVKALHGGAP